MQGKFKGSKDVEASVTVNGYGFRKQQQKNIKGILVNCMPMLSGVNTSLGSGGNFHHMAYQLNDKKWLAFHSATGAITLSAVPYETPDDFTEAFWEDEENALKWFIPTKDDEEFSDVDGYGYLILNKKFETFGNIPYAE